MAKVLSSKQSTQGSPYAFYTLELTATNRTETTVKINYTITSWLQYSNSYLGYSLNAYITAGGTKSSAIALKGTETWSGTTKHTKTGSFTVKGLTATTTSITTYLEVDNVEGTGAALDKTKGSSLTIPAYATATVPKVSPTTATLGSTAVTISMPRDVSSWKHKLTYAIGNLSGTIGEDLDELKTWTPPLDLAAGIPSASSGTMTITCQTFDANGNSKGSKSVNLTVVVPEEIVPTINAVTVEEAVAKVTSAFGARFLQNSSQLNVSLDAVGAYGATLKYSTSIDGVTYIQQAFTSNVLNTSGDLNLVVTVTDSRGRIATHTKTIKVFEYSSPTITGITAKVESSNVVVSISGQVFSVDGQNTKALKIRYKKVSETQSTEQAVSVPDWAFNTTAQFTSDSTASYEIEAVLTDAISSGTAKLTTGKTVLSRRAGGNGITIGAEAETDGFRVVWDSNFEGTLTGGAAELDITTSELEEIQASTGNTSNRLATLLKTIAYKVGLIADYTVETGTEGSWLYEKKASGRAVCYAKLQSTVSCTSATGTLYQGQVTVSLPSGLFTAVDNVQVTAAGSTGSGYSFFGRYVLSGTTSFNALFFGTVSASKSIDYSAYVIGKWK